MLALREFFWGTGGVPPVVLEPDLSHGGSGKAADKDFILPMADDFWLARETKLRDNTPQPGTPETLQEKKDRLMDMMRLLMSEQAELSSMQQQRQSALLNMQSAASVADLKAISEYIIQLDTAIGKLDTHYQSLLLRVKSLRFDILH